MTRVNEGEDKQEKLSAQGALLSAQLFTSHPEKTKS